MNLQSDSSGKKWTKQSLSGLSAMHLVTDSAVLPNETHEFPSQSRMDIMYPLIVENLTYVKSHPHIVPTFRGTVQAISQKYGIPTKLIHTTLSEMISKGLVIQKEQTSPDGRTARIISGNWKELSKEGLVK